MDHGPRATRDGMSIEIRSYLQRHPTVPRIQKKLWIWESKLESENYEEEEGFENDGLTKSCRWRD